MVSMIGPVTRNYKRETEKTRFSEWRRFIKEDFWKIHSAHLKSYSDNDMMLGMDCLTDSIARTGLLELMLRNTSPRGPLYVFTKRTHRFAEIFWVQTTSREGLALEMFERIRWVRFPKRTHFRGSNGGGERLF